MKTEKIKRLIKSNEDAFFIGKLNDKKIAECEEKLDVIFPESYKWFLREYGTGGINGVEILGGGLSDVSSCIEATLDWRKYGLPENYVVIENNGEWLYCLDTANLREGECPVIDWEQGFGCGSRFFVDFIDFLIYRFV